MNLILLFLISSIKSLFVKPNAPVYSLHKKENKQRNMWINTLKAALPMIVFMFIFFLIIIVLAFMGSTEANMYYYHIRG